MKREVYEKALRKLQEELCYLQDWIRTSGERVIVVLEGRDAAGKGTIKAITDRVSPRVFRVVALPAPSDREKSQMYVQRRRQLRPGGRRGLDRWCSRIHQRKRHQVARELAMMSKTLVLRALSVSIAA